MPRNTRNSNPKYASAAGFSALCAAISVFSCFNTMESHARTVPGASPETTNVTPMAFASHTLSLDSAFDGLTLSLDSAFGGYNMDENTLIRACEAAVHARSALFPRAILAIYRSPKATRRP